MLDLLFDSQKAERHPLELAIIGIFYSSLSILVGLWIFNKQTSTAIIFLTTISCLYVVQGAIRSDEKKEKNYNPESWMLEQHKPIIIMILTLFLGFVVSFSLWSFFLPPETSSNVFELQQSALEHIKSITGNSINPTTSIGIILKNNLNVVLISLLFALFFGAGAVYILAWNASVMGYVIGSLSRETFGLAALPIVAFKYFLHGIPEMLAYIVAAFAGGILYFALIRGDLTKGNRVKRIIIDVIVLLLISFILLLFSAIIEVFISPLI